MPYKTEIKKYKHLKNKYILTIYISAAKNEGLSDFIYFHLIKKYPNLHFFRSYSNKPIYSFGIEELSKTKALQIKKYVDGLFYEQKQMKYKDKV